MDTLRALPDAARAALDGLPLLRLATPAALALLLLLPLVLLLGLLGLRRAPRGQRLLALGLRLAIVALLAAALAQPLLGLPRRAQSVVFALDVSDSLTLQQQAGARAWVRRAAESLGPDANVQVIEFGQRAQLASLDGASAAVPGGATDLEGALRLAGSLLPGDGARSVVLITDGQETQGRAAAPGLVPAGVAVSYVLPAGAADGPEVALRSADVAPVIRAGDFLDLSAVVDSTVNEGATLRVTLDGQAVSEQQVTLAAGANRFSLAPRVASAGTHQLHVQIVPQQDTRVENNGLDAVTVAKEPGAVLILEDEAGTGRPLADILRQNGLSVETRRAASIPPSPDPLDPFDGIVLVDVPATSLTLDQQRTLQTYVRDRGKGLVVLGGPHSFAPGGYEGTILDDVLPVSAKPPVERQQGSVALFLVVDKSGSMDLYNRSGSKMVMAKEAAAQATQMLKPGDTLGVIAFDDVVDWVVRPTVLTGDADIRAAQQEIQGIRADGGTKIFPALEAAYQAARQSDAQLKHIVLLTDGQSFDADPDLIERMKPYHITLSTVAVGSDADTRLLSTLARQGDGRYYFTERSTEIPRIATKEATILTRNALVEGQSAALPGDASPLLRGLPGQFPALQGYVATTPKDRAVTALASDRGHPLLAHWQYGIGRAVAWTSDALGAWTAGWATWQPEARFWVQAVRWALPGPRQPDFQVSARVQGSQVTLSAESRGDDGHATNQLDTRATVVTPAGAALEVTLPQQGPGLYERTVEGVQPGAYRALLTQEQGGRALHQEVVGFAVPGSPELRTVGVNRALLQGLAERSGGRELRSPADLLAAQPGISDYRWQPLWPYPAALALLLFPLDVAVRRLRWPWLTRGARAD